MHSFIEECLISAAVNFSFSTNETKVSYSHNFRSCCYSILLKSWYFIFRAHLPEWFCGKSNGEKVSISYYFYKLDVLVLLVLVLVLFLINLDHIVLVLSSILQNDVRTHQILLFKRKKKYCHQLQLFSCNMNILDNELPDAC